MRRYLVPLSLLSVLIIIVFAVASAQRTVHAQVPVCYDKQGKVIACPPAEDKRERPTVNYPSFTPTSTLTPTPTATVAPPVDVPPAGVNDTSAGLPGPAGSPFILIGLIVGGAFLLGLLLWRVVRGINGNDGAPATTPIGDPFEHDGGTSMNNNETSMNDNDTSMNSNETSMNSNEGGTSLNTDEVGGSSMTNIE